MTESIAVDGLLHLGALSVVLTTGYLGIDRLQAERTTFYKTLEEISTKTRSTLDETGKADCIELPSLLSIHQVYILCYVARLRIKNKSRWISLICLYYHIKYIPLLGYFRAKVDRVVTSICAMISIISFIWLVSQSMKPDSFLYRDIYIDLLFWFYTDVVVWVFLSAAIAATRLQRIAKTCDALLKSVSDATRDLLSSSFASSTEGLGALAISNAHPLTKQNVEADE